MPLFHDEPAASAPEVVVSGSIAVELEWAISAAWQADFRRDHSVLAKLYDNHPELGERVRAMWSDSERTSCGGSIDLMVLAHHAGLLYSLDAKALLDNIEDICVDAPLDLALASETAEDRSALLARLRRLRASQPTRRRYAQLLNDVWSAVADDWQELGRAAVNAAVAERRDLYRRGSTWREVAGARVCSPELMADLVSALPPNGTVSVIPAFFTHLGVLVDLPGTVLLGVRTDNSGAEARARTELLARRLKVISDPTRLAMLQALRWRDMTVSELAAHFALAQPTVSTHVKLLREAGVISNRIEGGQRKLVVHQEALNDLLEHLGALFTAPDKT